MKSGIHGLFICGTIGEGPLLGIDQREAVAENAVDFVNGRVPIIIHTGTERLDKTSELTLHAEDIGADAVGIVVPYYYNYSQKELFEYYKEIARKTEIPIFIYNIPSRTGNNINVSTIKRLNTEFSQIIGLKDSSKDIIFLSEVLSNLPKSFIILIGSDALIFPGLLLGCKGAISTISNAFPELLIELYNKIEERDLTMAKEIQFKILQARNILSMHSYIAVYKAILRLKGIPIQNIVMEPLHKISSEEANRLFEALKRIGLI
ncbi:MAG: dihydrodipicolinate synthase family protein [Candidatus Korarchaeota archaeon]|nr:dihydrodipicolinate synthase family protein [Candidatus Korarchaeota archaeon]